MYRKVNINIQCGNSLTLWWLTRQTQLHQFVKFTFDYAGVCATYQSVINQ